MFSHYPENGFQNSTVCVFIMSVPSLVQSIFMGKVTTYESDIFSPTRTKLFPKAYFKIQHNSCCHVKLKMSPHISYRDSAVASEHLLNNIYVQLYKHVDIYMLMLFLLFRNLLKLNLCQVNCLLCTMRLG